MLLPPGAMEKLSFVFADKATVPGFLGLDVQLEVIQHILEVKPDKILLLCDQGALAHHTNYFEPLQQARCASAGETGGVDSSDLPVVVQQCLPEGDACKSWEHLGLLMRWAFDNGATKKSVVVAFGGGALMNLAGLFASILYRGTKLIYVPTTLLAMHDVTTSLKTSICFDGRKNNIGSFYAPLKILIDVGFCRTLPRKELFSGLGELAKNAALFGGRHAEGFIEALSKERVDAEHGGSGAEFQINDKSLVDLVRLGIEAKMHVLLTDAHEKTSGMIFEYGHTVSHAIEKAYGDGVIPHGLGVTYGMLSSSYAAEKLGIMKADDRKKHDELCWTLLKRWPLPEPKPTAEKVMKLAMRDSKRGICSEDEGEIADVLLRGMGDIVRTETQMLSKFPKMLVYKWLYSMGFPAENEKKNTSHYNLVGNEECRSLLNAIKTNTDSDLIGMGFEPLTVGFANHVWAIEKYGQPVVLKRYTELAFLRVEPEAIGVADVAAGEAGIGPHVFFSSAQGLVMQRLEGRTLEEKDMHKGDFMLLEEVAVALANLHRLPVPEACAGEPMLWRTVDKMLEVAGRKPELWPTQLPSLEVVKAKIAATRKAFECHSPKITMCHGDFKPSNVIKKSEGVKIIDFELAGPNYRGFDLMKVFRTAEGSSKTCMAKFLEVYSEKMREPSEGSFRPPARVRTDEVHSSDLACSEDDVASLLAECQYFEPLTWLEAAVFFLALPQFKPLGVARWNDLAVDRWNKFEATKEVLF